MELNHKCNGCRYRSEYQAMGFQPFGVCTRETNLIEAEKAYKADVCPYEQNLLKPCPFCGSTSVAIIADSIYGDNVYCENCKATIETKAGQFPSATLLWNRRANDGTK